MAEQLSIGCCGCDSVFSNGSAFASDATNLFWDDTNNRLGVGTNAPTSKLQIVTDDAINPQAFSNQTSVLAGTTSQGALISAFSSTNGGFINALWPGNAWFKMNYGGTNHSFSVGWSRSRRNRYQHNFRKRGNITWCKG
jgi:hypothetical protein